MMCYSRHISRSKRYDYYHWTTRNLSSMRSKKLKFFSMLIFNCTCKLNGKNCKELLILAVQPQCVQYREKKKWEKNDNNNTLQSKFNFFFWNLKFDEIFCFFFLYNWIYISIENCESSLFELTMNLCKCIKFIHYD